MSYDKALEGLKRFAEIEEAENDAKRKAAEDSRRNEYKRSLRTIAKDLVRAMSMDDEERIIDIRVEGEHLIVVTETD